MWVSYVLWIIALIIFLIFLRVNKIEKKTIMFISFFNNENGEIYDTKFFGTVDKKIKKVEIMYDILKEYDETISKLDKDYIKGSTTMYYNGYVIKCDE